MLEVLELTPKAAAPATADPTFTAVVAALETAVFVAILVAAAVVVSFVAALEAASIVTALESVAAVLAALRVPVIGHDIAVFGR